MSRLRVIIGGTARALLAAAVPIAVMAYATWDRAVSVEQQRLRDIAGRALRRADQSYQEALAALQSAEVGAHDACGPEHIRRMQTLVMTSPSVDQMGYFEGGKLRCTSWGPFLSDVNQPKADHVTSDGAGIAVDVRPEASGRRQVLSFLYGNYDVLVDPRRFVDVIARQPKAHTHVCDGILVVPVQFQRLERQFDRSLRIQPQQRHFRRP